MATLIFLSFWWSHNIW